MDFWGEWQELDGEQQAMLVAAYNAHNTMEAIMAEESRRKADGRSPIGTGTSTVRQQLGLGSTPFGSVE